MYQFDWKEVSQESVWPAYTELLQDLAATLKTLADRL